jgi:hypothetical protein
MGSRCSEPPHHGLRKAVTQQLLDLEDKLLAILHGEGHPADAAEGLALAHLCLQHKQLYAASARFYSWAFADQPRLAQDLRAGHRYNAACAAPLAASGQGKDADKLDDRERARLRKQALTWLRADLAAWGKDLDKDTPQARLVVRQNMQHWQKDPDLAAVRSKEALAKLPEAERKQWQQLWSDVATLLQRAREKKSSPPPGNPPS